MMIACFHSEIGVGDGAAVPAWVQLLPAGTFKGADGRGPYTVGNPAAVITSSMAAGRLPVDENHAIDLAAPKGGPSPARGWIVEMQARPDGIWGRINWTDTGRALVGQRDYRFISPGFEHNANGVVSKILRAALTNTPNLTQLPALNAQGASTNMSGAQHAAADADLLKTLSPDEVKIARHMGVEPIVLARQKARRNASGAGGTPVRPGQPDFGLTRKPGQPLAEGVTPGRPDFAPVARQSADAGDDPVKLLTAADLEVCRKMNIKPADLARYRQGGKNHNYFDRA